LWRLNQYGNLASKQLNEVIMSAEEKSFKPDKSDQRPTERKTDELDEKQLDKVSGGQTLGAGGVPGPPAPQPVG
jgi:hypothetical protein